jgi:peroxiredoxin
MARTPEVGEAAPDFTLPGVVLADGQAVRGEYALSGALRRSVFIVDGTGVVRWKHVTLVGLTFPSPAAITAKVAELTSAG